MNSADMWKPPQSGWIFCIMD